MKTKIKTKMKKASLLIATTLLSSTSADAQNFYACVPCPAGKYLVNGTCQTCPAGTYSGGGATSCSPCPDGTWSPAGSSICRQCSGKVAISDTHGVTAMLSAGLYTYKEILESHNFTGRTYSGMHLLGSGQMGGVSCVSSYNGDCLRYPVCGYTSPYNNSISWIKVDCNKTNGSLSVNFKYVDPNYNSSSTYVYGSTYLAGLVPQAAVLKIYYENVCK